MNATETRTETPTAAPARPKSMKALQAEEGRLVTKLLAATHAAGQVAANLEAVRKQIAQAQPQADGGGARARDGG
jgi:hypothetical protein